MIKKGDKFRCIKTLMYANSDLWYQKGKIYTSDMDGCITDEDGDIDQQELKTELKLGGESQETT